MDYAGLQQLWISAGGDPSQAATAAAIALAESGGNPGAVNHSSIEYSVGLWQINTYAHPQWTPDQLTDPMTNAQAAIQVSGNGSNWNPWTTYTSGAYRQYLGGSSAASAQLMSAQVGSDGGTGGTATSPLQAQVAGIFNPLNPQDWYSALVGLIAQHADQITQIAGAEQVLSNPGAAISSAGTGLVNREVNWWKDRVIPWAEYHVVPITVGLVVSAIVFSGAGRSSSGGSGRSSSRSSSTRSSSSKRITEVVVQAAKGKGAGLAEAVPEAAAAAV